jgi:hypothetical protein
MAGQIVKLIGAVPVGANQAAMHGLIRIPTVHALAIGTGANVTKGNAPSATQAFYSNGGAAAAQAVVALLIALHSLDSDRIVLLEGVSPGAGAFTVAHGLSATPAILFAAVGTAAAITANAITADAVNVTMTASAGGQAFSILAIALHSLWGSGQWSNLLSGTMPGAQSPTQVAANAINQAFAHGLARLPAAVLLGARTGTLVTLGAGSPDPTNIFISSTNAAAQNLEALVIAGHSMIA